MSDSAEIIKEMREQGLISEERAAADLAKIEKKESSRALTPVDNENAVLRNLRDGMSAAHKAVQQALQSTQESVKEAPATETPKKKKSNPDARKGNESVGMYAARLYGDELEISPGKWISVQELIDGINAKKIKEKAFDLVRFLRLKVKISCYTKIGFKELAKFHKMPLHTLCEAMQNGVYGTKYSDGTSRSQSQQVHSLFKTFGIIDAASNEIEDSPILSCIQRYLVDGEDVSVLRRNKEEEN